MVLKVNQQALQAFRRHACEVYPREYVEILAGTVSKKGEIRIERFYQIEQTLRPKYVLYTAEEIDQVRKKAKAWGLMMLGSIHSHPNADDHPSEQDNQESYSQGELVFGILSVRAASSGRKHTTLAWWPVQNPITRVTYF
jgi:proteasome lid subunit RPN8/RPN11